MTQGHSPHPRMLWKWLCVACCIPWPEAPMGGGKVVADPGVVGGLFPTVWPRGAWVLGSVKGLEVGEPWLPEASPPTSPPSPAEPCSLAPGQKQAQQVPGVWQRPAAEPDYTGPAVSGGSTVHQEHQSAYSRSPERQRGHEPGAVLCPACPGKLCHALRLLPAPASPAAHALGAGLPAAPGGPPSR